MEKLLDDLWLSRHPKDALFLSIIEGYEIKVSKKYPNEIFYMKNDRILIDYDLKRMNAFISEKYIWSIFESEFKINRSEIEGLLIYMLETYLNLYKINIRILSRYSELMEANIKKQNNGCFR